MENNKNYRLPSAAELEEELERLRYKDRFQNSLRTTICVLITVAAFALLVATLVMPVLQVYGVAMEPSVKRDSFVVTTKTGSPEQGDVLAFYHNNKILIRRVIAGAGDTVLIDKNGRVAVNGETLTESYVEHLDLGTTNIEYPYEVPIGSWFVLGDNRLQSMDSRVSLIGCVEEEDFIGVCRLCIWPLDNFGIIK